MTTPFFQQSLGEQVFNVGVLFLSIQVIIRLIWAAWRSRKVKFKLHCIICKQTQELSYVQFAKMKATHFAVSTPFSFSFTNAHCPHCNAKRELTLTNLYEVAPGLKVLWQTFGMGLLLVMIKLVLDKFF